MIVHIPHWRIQHKTVLCNIYSEESEWAIFWEICSWSHHPYSASNFFIKKSWSTWYPTWIASYYHWSWSARRKIKKTLLLWIFGGNGAPPQKKKKEKRKKKMDHWDVPMWVNHQKGYWTLPCILSSAQPCRNNLFRLVSLKTQQQQQQCDPCGLISKRVLNFTLYTFVHDKHALIKVRNQSTAIQKFCANRVKWHFIVWQNT